MGRRRDSYGSHRDSFDEDDDLIPSRRPRRYDQSRDFSPARSRWDQGAPGDERSRRRVDEDLPGPPRRERSVSPRDLYRSDYHYERSRRRSRSPECSYRRRHREDDYDRGRSLDDTPPTNTLLVKEFQSVNTAESALDGWMYDVLDRAGLHRISLDFAQPLLSAKGTDWSCEVCDMKNFARRETCVKCRTPKAALARQPSSSRRLCIRHLPEQFTEEDVKVLIADHGAASDVQLLHGRDGASRGIAYVTFSQVHESAKALEALDGVRCGDEHSRCLTVSFASDRADDPERPRGRDSDHNRSSIANEAVAAAAAMNAYLPQGNTAPASEAGDSWKPRSFSIAALSEQEEAKGGGGGTAEGGAAHGSTNESAAGGFVYDEASGYYYDAASGYYYDAATQLYYHSSTQAWYRYNAETGEYDVVHASESAQEAATTAVHAEPSSTAAANGQDTQSAAGPAVSHQVSTVSAQTAAGPAAVAATSSAADAASKREAAAKKKALVNDFLKRKAEEQRKAARDFLKAEAAPQQPEAALQDAPAAEPPAKVQCTGTAVTTTVPQGILRQKVYSSAPQPSEASVPASDSTLVQAVAGGVIRGKSYRRAG